MTPNQDLLDRVRAELETHVWAQRFHLQRFAYQVGTKPRQAFNALEYLERQGEVKRIRDGHTCDNKPRFIYKLKK